MENRRAQTAAPDPNGESGYGWAIVGAAMMSIAIQTAINHSTGLFLVAIADDTGWSRATISLAVSVYFIGIGIWSPLIGVGMRQWGPRRFMPLAALVAAAGLYAASQAPSPLVFALVLLGPIALGNTGQGSLSNFTTVQAWFRRRRGIALGLADTGASLGIVIIIPILHSLILSAGWRPAYQALAGVIVLMAPLHFLLQRNPPQAGADPGPEPAAHVPLATLLHSRQFWLIFAGLAASWFSAQMISVHQVAYLTDSQFDAISIDIGFASTGLAGVVGRLAFGWISDRLGTLRAFALNTVFVVAGIAALVLAGQTGWVAFVLLYGVLYGSSLGVGTLMFARQVTEIFGGHSFSTVMGLAYVGACTGGAAGAALGGLVADTSGSYLSSFTGGAVAAALSLVCMHWLGSLGRRAVAGVPGA